MGGRRNRTRRSGKVRLMVRDAMLVCLYAYCRAYFMSKTVLAYIVYKLLLSTLCCETNKNEWKNNTWIIIISAPRYSCNNYVDF